MISLKWKEKCFIRLLKPYFFLTSMEMLVWHEINTATIVLVLSFSCLWHPQCKLVNQLNVELVRQCNDRSGASVKEEDKKDKSLVVRVGGGPLQLLRIIRATGGSGDCGVGVGPSSLVLGEPQEKGTWQCKMRRKGGREGKKGKMTWQGQKGKITHQNCKTFG